MTVSDDGKAQEMPPPHARRRGSSEKQSEKKRELALHTLSALSELGFARLNLREVAARSGTSLGSIHYYFADKTELLIYCIRLYKDDFVERLQELIDGAADLPTLISLFPEALVQSIEQYGLTHRLWYDVRAQALFDPAFQPVVDEIETRLVALAGHFLGRTQAFGALAPAPDALGFYLMLDGCFRYGLQQHIAGNPHACDELRARLLAMAPSL